MGDEDARGDGRVGAPRKRRETLPDGRYLIYFTFGGDEAAPPAEGARARPEPEAAAGPAEERRV